jgi:hypothetical protein
VKPVLAWHIITWPPATDKDGVTVTQQGLQWNHGQNICTFIAALENALMFCLNIVSRKVSCALSASFPLGTGSKQPNVKISNFMELVRSWEAASCAATHEPPNILWNPKVHYRVHKSPPVVPALSQIEPVHTNPSYLSKISFNVIHPPTSWSSSWSLSFRLSHQYPICIPLHPSVLSNPPWLHRHNYARLRLQVMN